MLSRPLSLAVTVSSLGVHHERFSPRKNFVNAPNVSTIITILYVTAQIMCRARNDDVSAQKAKEEKKTTKQKKKKTQSMQTTQRRNRKYKFSVIDFFTAMYVRGREQDNNME